MTLPLKREMFLGPQIVFRSHSKNRMFDDALILLNKIIDINLFETFLKGMTGVNEKKS